MEAQDNRPFAAPRTDPTSIFEYFRGSYGSELLTAAIAHFGVFRVLAEGSLSFEELSQELGLERPPMIVVLTALKAMGLVEVEGSGRLVLSDQAQEHLVAGTEFYVGDYEMFLCLI